MNDNNLPDTVFMVEWKGYRCRKWSRWGEFAFASAEHATDVASSHFGIYIPGNRAPTNIRIVKYKRTEVVD